MATFVVSGATGHVGSVVASERLARGDEVRVVSRDRQRAATWTSRGAKAAIGSLDDARFLSATLAGADGFLALLPEDRGASDPHGARRRMTDAIAGAVRESGVPRVVVVSSLGADLPSGTGPIQDLHYLENALRATGVVVIALRAAYFQENVAAMAPLAERAGIYPNFMPSSEAAFPTIATRDLGRVAADLLASGTKSEVVDVIGPFATTRAVAAALGAAIGKRLQVVDVPPPGRVAALEQAGVTRALAESYAEMFQALGAGRVAPRGDRTVQVTTTIEETLRTMVPRPA